MLMSLFATTDRTECEIGPSSHHTAAVEDLATRVKFPSESGMDRFDWARVIAVMAVLPSSLHSWQTSTLQDLWRVFEIVDLHPWGELPWRILGVLESRVVVE